MEAIRGRFDELATQRSPRRVPLPRSGDEIARLVHTMNTTLGRLQTAVDEQRRFVADASHELRSPLTALRAELEIALSRPEQADWPQVVHGALGDTQRLQRLATDLLLLARFDSGGEDRGAQTVDLADLVREEVARRHPPTHLTLQLDSALDPVLVHGHPALLTRVLGNLLDNAERHADTAITIRLSHDPQQRQAVIEVLDDGPGIPPADRQRVFERFTRLDDARTRDTGGTGLGLAIAYHITALHRGTLKITPSLRGAHFALHLPTCLS
ncbi:hypothetical protein AQJ58_24355 [Streptomyces sp. DSM 15324]|nr:hypothetical protein AQJ58_24355 [Streptomyces sp. DSM 15324]